MVTSFTEFRAQSRVLQVELSGFRTKPRLGRETGKQGGGVNSQSCLSAYSRSGLGFFMRAKQNVISLFLGEESPHILLGWPRQGYMAPFGL